MQNCLNFERITHYLSGIMRMTSSLRSSFAAKHFLDGIQKQTILKIMFKG